MNGPRNWPTPKNLAASNVGKANPSRNTKPELLLRSVLHKLGYRFRIHYRVVDGGKRPPEVDIAFTRQRLAVQVHGSFWHNRSGAVPKHNADYWAAKFAYNKARDIAVAERLAAAGWRLVEVWDNDPLLLQVEKVVAALGDDVGSSRRTPDATPSNVKRVASATHKRKGGIL